jgi:hypothetical protein
MFCLGGDDGHYGWLGLPGGPAAPAVIAISFARSEFHKNMRRIVG